MSNVVAFPGPKPTSPIPQRCSRIVAVRRQGRFHYVVLLDDQSLESGSEYVQLDDARYMAAFWTPEAIVEIGPPEAFGRAGA
jgi:hypothetical protein